MRLKLLCFVGVWGLAISGWCQTGSAADIKPMEADHLGRIETVDDLLLLEKNTRTNAPSEAIPDEPAIAYLTAVTLERSHYKRHPVDDAVSSEFLDRYLDVLDGPRLLFLQSDLDEFEKYRLTLDDQILRGETEACREIFGRFLERFEQRVLWVAELLQKGDFDFTGNDTYLIDRREAPRPKDLAAAKELWRQHLRYEVLQELLSLQIKDEETSAAKATDAQETAQPDATSSDPTNTESANHDSEELEEKVIGVYPKLPEQVLQAVTSRYGRLLRNLRTLDSADIFEIYLSSLMHVYDPHSDYLGKPTLDNFAINMNLSLFGIGAVLQSEDGYCKVRELKPGPAMRSKKIKVGDRIVGVAQGTQGESVDVIDMKLSKIVDLIRGPKGTDVNLTIIPVDAADPSERVLVTLTRDEIKIEDEEARAQIIDLPDENSRMRRIGVINLPSFYASFNVGSKNGRPTSKSTTQDVAALLSKLKEENVEGIVLDLRENGGGSLDEAIQLTGLFIKKGPVVQVRNYNGVVEAEEDWDPSVVYDGPLIVLTSRFSASASEILAGALQDYDRALIVGDSSTHGKGTVQSMVQLKPVIDRFTGGARQDPGALKLTVRQFYRATGESTQLNGVVPDIVLPSVNNYREVGEQALDAPLPWNSIDPVPFEPEHRIKPHLEKLRRLSEQRVQTGEDFAFISEDIERYQEQKANQNISLNEKERRREQSNSKQRLEERKKWLEHSQEAGEKIYDIALKDAATPGLPDPTISKQTPDVTEPVHSSELLDEPESPLFRDVMLRESWAILLDLIDLSQPTNFTAAEPKQSPVDSR